MALSEQLISFLQFLLPGFLAAWVFYGFVPHTKPNQFERIIEALVFTLIIQAIVRIEEPLFLWIGQWISIGEWTRQSEALAPSATAIVIGITFAFCVNKDFPHWILRLVGMTRETTGPNEWFRAFYEDVTYIVLHLKDGRRLYGWPARFPSTPNSGEFVIRYPAWVHVADNEDLKDVTSILISATEVEWVEFLRKDWKGNGKWQKIWRRWWKAPYQ